MNLRACVACVIVLAACDQPLPDHATPAGGGAQTAVPPDAAALSELNRIEAAVKQAPDDHPLADRYRALAVEHGLAHRAVRWLESLAADPATGREANIHFQLAMAYVEALKASGPLSRGPLAANALKAFDAALVRDSSLWEARYGKGMLYLGMPASFKQFPKAIEAFTDLIDRQTRLPPRPEFALTYVRLSEAYSQSGDRSRAAAVLRQGLQRFADAPALREALAALEEEHTHRDRGAHP